VHSWLFRRSIGNESTRTMIYGNDNARYPFTVQNSVLVTWVEEERSCRRQWAVGSGVSCNRWEGACFTYLFKAYTAAFLLLLFSYVATVYLFWGIPFIQTTRPIHVAWYLRASRASSWKQLRKYYKNDLDLVSLCMCNSQWLFIMVKTFHIRWFNGHRQRAKPLQANEKAYLVYQVPSFYIYK
jgi:hypothetical protein